MLHSVTRRPRRTPPASLPPGLSSTMYMLLPQRRQVLPRRQDFPRGNPRLSGNPQIHPPGLRKPPSTVPTGFPLTIPERMTTRLPRNAGIPKTRRGVVTPPSDLPETSASPTQVTVAVTGMFHTLHSVTRRPRRTLLDSAGLPPGLSSTTMVPFPSRPTPRSERLFYAAPAHPRTISLYGSSVHNNMSEPVYESTHGTLPNQINPTITRIPDYIYI